MLRSIAKDTAASFASWTRLDAAARRAVRRTTPYVVGYHRVVDAIDRNAAVALPAMEITTAMLEQHLDWLGRHFEIVSPADLIGAPRRGRKPLAAVTFDDGYADTYHHAFPLLQRKGIPAAFFVVTDLVGGGVPVHDRLYAAVASAHVRDPFALAQHLLRNRNYNDIVRTIDALDPDGEISRRTAAALQPMTWDMLATMRDAGMTIGSHSQTHAFLTKESPARIEEELRQSRAALRHHLAIEADCFAYPGGAFNDAVVDVAARAGYRLAFTDCRHSDERHPLLTIRRRGLWERSCADRAGRFSPAIMSCHAASLFDRFAVCPDGH